MSVSRGKFLKSLTSAIPGMVIGSGAAAAAQQLLGKIATASGPIPKPSSITGPGGGAVDFIRSGPPEGNRIALTFDDGPTPGVTDRILDELNKRKLPATFFMIGSRAEAAPELARRVRAEGHEIANHTFTHAKLTALPDPQVGEEIQKAQTVLHDLLGVSPAWFRPPYGAFRQNQAALAQHEGLGIVLWSVDSTDWAQPGETKIVSTILAETKPGAIILCHDLHSQTANCVGEILDGLLQREFTFVTLSALLTQSQSVTS